MRVEALTFFRFIAAAIVVVFHYGRDATGFSGVLTAGPEMVTFFFVLSGFVMGIAYLNKEVSVGSYWWARVARIMPIYLLALLLVVVSYFASGKSVNYMSLALSLTLLQSWISPHPTSLNAPGWSLSVEAFFYLSFPLILYFIKKYSASALYVACFSLTLWGVTQVVTTIVLSGGFYDGGHSLSHDLIYYFPLTHLCSFVLGVFGSMWVMSKKHLDTNNIVTLMFVIFTSLVIVISINNKELIGYFFGLKFAYGSSFFAPLFLFFIVSIALCRSNAMKIFGAPPLVLLGEASYSLYILQMPIHAIYEKYISGILNFQPLESFVMFFIFLTGVSIFTFLLIEKPTNRFLRFSLPVLVAQRLARTRTLSER